MTLILPLHRTKFLATIPAHLRLPHHFWGLVRDPEKVSKCGTMFPEFLFHIYNYLKKSMENSGLPGSSGSFL
jgi:hypothetical protein